MRMMSMFPGREQAPADDAPLVDESAAESDDAGAQHHAAPDTAGQRRRLGAAAVGTCLGAAALLATAARAPGGGAGVAGVGGAIGLDEEADAPLCAAEGQDCHTSKCCLDGGAKGLQCYSKDKFWAACLESCKPGVHEGEKHGTYNQWGKFELDKWTCDEHGKRSLAGCGTFKKEGECPDKRCMWRGGECFQACDTYPAAESCGTNPKCMWQGKCMEACGNFNSSDTCKPSDKCVWNMDRCMPGWWTYSTPDSCPHENGYFWNGTCSKDPCSAPGEDCRSTKCCSMDRGGSGMTCFAKDDTWGSCMETCAADDWSCKALGERTNYSAGCAWAGESCMSQKLCCNRGFTCAKKDETFAGCAQTVQKTTWMTKHIPLPGGWAGDVLGGGRDEYQIWPAKEGVKVMGTTMYCFMAFLPDSYEVSLKDVAKKNGASIYGCDGHDLFHSWQSTKGAWDTGEATLTNTDVFINVWDQVRQKGNYLKYDWTIKADADCVMVPDRMRSHLAGLRVPADVPAYVKNHGMDPGLGNNGFLGAVEVFNKKAVQIYFDNAEGCRKTLGIQCGEDGFFKGCMDALGVGFARDVEMFFPDHSSGACSQAKRAAFHPLKDPKEWQHCWDIVTGKVPW